MADENKFRRDLIYRINTVDIMVPPLRDRGGDIILLTRHFLEVYCEKYQKGPFELDKSFLSKLKNHSFPGNVRELQYVLERAVIIAERNLLTEEDLVFSAIEKPSETVHKGSMKLGAIEKNTILSVIKKHKGNISRSAEELGITRAALYRRLEKYDL